MTDKIACVSVRQPWAHLCAWGVKPIENRIWHCAHRGPIAIYAGKTWGPDEEAAYGELMAIAVRTGDRRRRKILTASRKALGGLVGVCVMTGCVYRDDWYADGGRPYDGANEWFTGPFGWRWERARPIPNMIAYRGQQGLFRIPRVLVAPYMEGL